MKSVSRIMILVVAGLTASCSSMRFEDFFSGYAEQMKASRQFQHVGDYQQAIGALPVVASNHNNFNLVELERARLSYLKHDYAKSQQNFEQVYQLIERENLQAEYRLSRGLQNVGAVATNDVALSYQIPEYEQAMLHSYQALNFAYQGKLSSALVEVRRANLVQETAFKENEQELLEAEQELTDAGMSMSSIYSSYPAMDPKLNQIKKGFQNAYTFYLSGVLYEAAGELNDAYIDYKRAIDIYPENTYLQHDVLRLAKQLGMKQDIELFSKRFAIAEDKETQSANVVILFEQAQIEEKREIRIDLPVYTRHDDLRFFSFAVPAYQESLHSGQPLIVSYGDEFVTTQDIVHLQSLAHKSLHEKLPGIVARQGLRIVAKEEFRRKMQKEGGDVGNILASLYNIASEKADTRSWLTLPNSIQMARLTLPVGEHNLKFNVNNQSQHYQITVKPGGITLVTVSSSGANTSTNSVVL